MEILIKVAGIGYIDAHGLKIRGRGYLMFLPKSLSGSRLSGKIAWGGGSPYFGFYCIFMNKCFEICMRGVLYLPSPDMIGEEIHKNVDSFHKS
jgi:hypothetical protein